MSRPLRVELAGGLYHVTSRGDGRDNIYLDDADRSVWLEVLAQVCERFNWVIHAWCQMSNHYHVVAETPEANLAQGMRHLNGVYTQRFNRAHKRVGHVFQGRYKAILVEKDSYLLELARYVVLNPVRAGMVKGPRQWRWSSYRVMTGVEEPPDWLQTDWILGQFGQRRATAIAKYIDFVREGVGLPSIWQALQGQVFLGSAAFVKRMQTRGVDDAGNAQLSEVPRAQRRVMSKPLTHYAQKFRDRDEAMVQAYCSGDYSMQAIAAHFGVHYSTVSRAISCSSR